MQDLDKSFQDLAGPLDVFPKSWQDVAIVLTQEIRILTPEHDGSSQEIEKNKQD